MLEKIVNYGKKIVKSIALPLTLLASLEGCTALSKPQIIPYQDSYIQVTDEKSKTKVTVFRKGDIEITLMGVSHIGTKRYYSEIEKRLNSADIIIAEGPKNERSFANALATFPFRYIDYLNSKTNKFNSTFFTGLEQQKNCLKPKIKIVIADMTHEEYEKRTVSWTKDNKSNFLLWLHNLDSLPGHLIRLPLIPVSLVYNFIDAGIGCATIGPKEFKNRKKIKFENANTETAKTLREIEWREGEKNEGYKTLFTDRDKYVLPALYEAIKKGYRKPAIVRGALHMENLDKSLERDGWKKVNGDWLETMPLK